MSRSVPVSEVRPSQLYLSSEKLASVCEWLDFDDPDYEPLPAFEYEGAWYLADGHTRAFAAYLAGAEQLQIYRDETVREAYDFDVYETCIEWCAEADVDEIADLRGRIVEPETYERVWIERCQQVG